MGHYDDCYEHEEKKARDFRKRENKKAKDLINQALSTAHPNEDNREIFRQKLEEALFWLEK